MSQVFRPVRVLGWTDCRTSLLRRAIPKLRQLDPAVLDLYDPISQFPNAWRMRNKHDLMESPDLHCPPQHPNIFQTIVVVQRSDRFIAKQRLITDSLAFPRVVHRDPQIQRFVYEYELPARKFVHGESAIQRFVPNLHIEIIHEAAPISLWPLGPEADLEFVVEATFA